MDRIYILLTLAALILVVDVSDSNVAFATPPSSPHPIDNPQPVNSIEGKIHIVPQVDAEKTISQQLLINLSKESDVLKEELRQIRIYTEENFANLKNQKKEPGFAIWTSILLGCVAIIVTALGVIIGLLALVGYKEIKNETKKTAESIAKQVSEETSSQVANAQVNEITKTEVAKLIQNGDLREQLESAVDVIMRKNLTQTEPSGFLQYPELDEELIKQ